MIFVRPRSPKNSEYPIPGGLDDVAAVMMHRINHQFEGRIDDGGFLWIEIRNQSST